MKPIHKILIPTDFSACAEAALERALYLRQHLGGSITLFHVYQLPVIYPDGFTFTADTLNALETATRQQMERLKARAEGMARDMARGQPVPPIETRVLAGAPAMAIVDEARAGGYDLVVMGTHGRTGLPHLLIGSVAERVVRTAPCAVLTVREPAA